jgi:two-component system, LytTR family, sensor kinase
MASERDTATRRHWPVIAAALWGIAVGWMDLSATAVQGPLLLLMIGAFALAAAGTRAAWVIACTESFAFTLLHVVATAAGARGGGQPLGTIIAIVPLLIAAYGGFLARSLVTRWALAVPLGDNGTIPVTASPRSVLPWYAAAAASRTLVGLSLAAATIIGFGPVYATLFLLRQPNPVWTAGVWQIASLLFWLAIAPLLLRAQTSLLTPAKLFRAFVILIAAAAVHAVVLVAATLLLFIPLGPGGTVTTLGWVFAAYLPIDALLAVLLRAIAFAADAQRHARQRAQEESERQAGLRAELHASRLDALRAQLRPHFFLNALNAAVTLARRGESTAVADMLGSLGVLLRYVLEDHGDLVPLDSEVRFVEQYLAVEGVRFADRLRTSVVVSPRAATALVPPLLLQTLVENAIHHGIARRLSAGQVTIRAWTEGDASAEPRLLVTVIDDGPGPDSGSAPEGVGLRNARSRLAVLFGGRAELSLTACPGGGAESRLSLPLVTRS